MGKHPRKRRHITRPVISTDMQSAMAQAVGDHISREVQALIKTAPRLSYEDACKGPGFPEPPGFDAMLKAAGWERG